MRKRAILFTLLTCLVLASATAQSGSGNAVTPARRFIDNRDGTMTDTVTGLMWEQAPTTEKMNLGDAHKRADNLTLAGYTDWRLPWRIEMTSLLKDKEPDAATWLLSQGFKGIQAADYWSGSYFHYIGLDYGWIVSGKNGATDSHTQEYHFNVWLVRQP